MKITLQQLMESYCATLLQVQSTFMIMQRSAFLELMRDEFTRVALNQHQFIGIEELVLSIYLRPKKHSWLMKWLARWRKKDLPLVYEIVSHSHPGAIHCRVIFRRDEKKYSVEINTGEKEKKDPLYVDIA